MASNSASNQPIRPTIVPEGQAPIRVIIERPRTSWLASIFKWGALALLGLIVIGWISNSSYYESDAGPIHERWHSLSKSPTAEKVAIISITGLIADGEGFAKAQIDQVRADERVKAIVLRVDSPGGTVTASDYIHHHLKLLTEERKIPLVVSMGGTAASGGYYVAMAAGDGPDLIFAEPTTWTGSIGVVIPHYEFSDLLERIHVEDDSIASRPLKLMGSPTKKMPEAIRAEEQQILQTLVDDSYRDFKDIVLASRKSLRDDPALQETAFSGQIFTARQAQATHLIDKIGFIEAAIDRAIQLANLNKDDVSVVKYHRPLGLMEQLLLGVQGRASPLDPTALLELSQPKAYYLFTWAPNLKAAMGH